MEKIEITLTGEIESTLNIVEGIKFITNSRTDENVTIQIGINTVTMRKEDIIDLLDTLWIDTEMVTEMQELLDRVKDLDEEFNKEEQLEEKE